MRLFKLATFLLLTVSISIILIGCKKETQISEKQYFDYFDTVITIKIFEQEVTKEQWNNIEDILKQIQYTFKRDAPIGDEEVSELYKLNQTAGSGEPFECSSELYEVIKIGMNYAKQTNGKLNPAIGPLVDLWDITGKQEQDNPNPPTLKQINDVLPLIDYSKVILDDENKSVILPEPGMILDLGAIAKGFAADKLAHYLSTNGFEHAIIDLGGNILAFGNRHVVRDDGTYNWSIGIRDPKSEFGKYVGLVYVTNKTVVSSGTYERYFIGPDINNPDKMKAYHHILDSTTGYPVENNLSSVSIITTSSTNADALSTAVFSLGLEDGLAFIEGFVDVEAVFITKDNVIYKTSGVDSKYNYKNM